MLRGPQLSGSPRGDLTASTASTAGTAAAIIGYSWSFRDSPFDFSPFNHELPVIDHSWPVIKLQLAIREPFTKPTIQLKNWPWITCDKCFSMTPIQWSYNVAMLQHGCYWPAVAMLWPLPTIFTSWSSEAAHGELRAPGDLCHKISWRRFIRASLL